MRGRLLVHEIEGMVRRHLQWVSSGGRVWRKSNSGQAARDRARLLEHLASLGPEAPVGLAEALREEDGDG